MSLPCGGTTALITSDWAQAECRRTIERSAGGYGKFVKAQVNVRGAKANVRRHRELFVRVDSSDPAQSGVTIARLSWDKMLDGSEGTA